MKSRAEVEESRAEVSLRVPGRIPLEVRFSLRGSRRTLEELFLMLARLARAEEIGVAGGDLAWNFSQNGTRVHLVVDRD